MFQKGKKN